LPILESNINFDGGNAFDELGESTYEYLANWDKLRFYFGPGGNQNMAIQILWQLDGTKLHWRYHVRWQEKWRKLMSFLVQPSSWQGSTSLLESLTISLPSFGPSIPLQV
jgi:hypothetical protein